MVVCTFNRCKTLQRTLESFRDISTPEGCSWELILVDNNSKDKTKMVAEEFQEEYGLNVEYVFEGNQGLSHARNRGISQARGEIIAFTDDDVIVDRHWLANIEKAFREYEVSCVGGKILPIWEISKPEWLRQDLHYIVALLDHGDKPFYLKSPTIWGANFAVKSEIFERYGVFDINLGRSAKRLFAGEDTEFVRRMLNAGEKVLYYPHAVVYHCIPRERISKKYFRRWKYDQGVLRASLLENSRHKKYMGIPYNPMLDFLKSLIAFFRDLRYLPGNRFVYELGMISYIGFILQIIRNNKL